MTTPQATTLISGQQLLRVVKWTLTVIVVVILANHYKKQDEASAARATATAAATKPAAVPEMILSCGGDKEYLELPEVRSITLIINPTGEKCSTAWLRRPRKATYVYSDPESDIKMQMSVGEGKITEWLDDSPLINRFGGQSLNAARYKNLTGSPVRIPVTIHY